MKAGKARSGCGFVPRRRDGTGSLEVVDPPLSCPSRGPLGGPNPLSTLLCPLHSAAHIIHDHALAYSFLCVASALPLLHVPRFPFHDSTGFRFCSKTNGKPYIWAPIGVPKRALWRGLWGASLGPSGWVLWGSPGAFRGSKNTEVFH